MYQSPFSMFAPFMIITGVVLFLIGTIYLISRIRSDQLHLSLRHIVEGYFYLIMVISFIIFTFGMITLLNAGFSGLLGRDFSYFSYGRPPPYYPVPAMPVTERAYLPGVAMPPQTEALTPEQQEELRQKEEQRQIEENRKRQEQSHREGLTEGVGMAFAGGIVWALHIWGRRRFHSAADSISNGIRRSYLVVMLVIYSIMGLTAITMAVSRVLRQYILYDIDKYAYVPAPGPVVAAGIILVPVWIYFLTSLINEMKEKENEGTA